MSISFIQIGWVSLFLFQISISAYLFYLYLLNNDKRKLIFGIGFMFSSFPHLYNGYLINVLSYSLLLDAFYRWSFYPIVFSIGIAVHAILFKYKNNNRMLFTYLAIILISFISISFSPLNISKSLDMAIGFIAIEIIIASAVLTLIKKKINELFLLLSLLCLTVGSITISETVTSAIFIFFIGLLFIGFSIIFPRARGEKSGISISEYFSLAKQLKNTESALVESEENFKRIFNEMVDATAIIDHRGTILEVSGKLLESTGYSKDELKGKNFLTLPAFDNETKRKLIKNVGLRLAGIHIPPYEVMVHTKYGDTIPFELHAGKVTFKGKKADLAVFRDLTERKKAIETLRESEQKFRSFTENASIAIMIYQEDKWIYANPHAEQITGYNQHELIGTYFWDIIHPDYKDLIIQKGKSRQAGETSLSLYKSKIITKQGQEKWVEFRANTICHKKKLAVLITASDITDYKQSADLMSKQFAAIKSSMDGVGILDVNQQFTYINQAHVQTYGYESANELLGKNWQILYDEKELTRFQEEIMPLFQKEGKWRGEVIGKKKDGSRFNQEVTLTALEDGGMVCVVRDITRQKMVLQELHDAHEVLFTINKDLERKVQQRTEEVEHLVKQKDEFINQLGHDLKTPLTPIMVLLPMLEKKAKSENERELFTVINRNVLFMKELVNKTINLAKLNSDKIEFHMEPVSLSDEIKNAIGNNQVLFDENDIIVENHVKDPLSVEGDRIQLQELLNNLITNAVKYSHEEGGSIFIDAVDDSSFVTISVRDTGIGMDDEQIIQAFNEFYKADDSRHNLDSSGLGLNICKRIVEKHGGKIWVESQGKDQGSTFYFTLRKSKKQSDDVMESSIETS